jgi:uncharacterized protein
MMLIGLISDSHNDITALQRALAVFREKNIHTVLHCGDLTSPQMVKLFADFTLHLAFGNGDYLTGEIKEQAILLGTQSTAKPVNTLTIHQTSIAIAHGHRPGEVSQLAESGQYHLLFTGHTHEREEYWIGNTRVINPGGITARAVPSHSFAIFDLKNDILEFQQL